jgi:SH3 domain protein
VLEIDEDSGYARVRTEDGLTGYMLMQYLQDEPAARSELAGMRQRLAQLQQEPDELAARLGELQTEYAALASSHEILTAENERLEQELAEIRFASANAMRIDRERRELQEQVSNLLLKVDQLEHRNLELANRSKQEWFLIGAGVMVGGIAIGLLLPHLRLRRRRSSTWGSL